MSDNSFQLEIASVHRRIESMTKKIGALTEHECHVWEKSELEGFEESEGILRLALWLISWVLDRYSLIISLWVQRCERKLVRYESRLADLKKLDRDEFELAVLMDIKKLTETVWPSDVG